jgi:membrane protein
VSTTERQPAREHRPVPREDGPSPQPERSEPRHPDPGLRDLSRVDYVAILKRSLKEAKEDEITDSAAALAYYAFLAIPATLLVALGLFSVLAGQNAIQTVLDKVGTVAPHETVVLLDQSLTRATENRGGSIVMLVIGFILALWTAMGAMTAVMRALNRAYERKETRGFVRQRLTALAMLASALLSFLLAFGLLVLGPQLENWLGKLAGLESSFGWIWWAGQWPLLIGGLLLCFAAILYLGPNVDPPRWRFLTPGSVLAVALWLVASAGFAAYVSMFGSYNKAWGSLAAVVIMLIWLWLGGLALLFGAEVNAEAERSRELRRGEPAEQELQAPTKA